MSNYLDGILSGQSGYSKTTAAFAQPAVGSNVTVFVGNAGWAIAGVAVNIAIGGSYQVVAVPSLTQLTLKNLGGSANAAPASTVPTAQVIAPGGTPGLQGTPGSPIDVATMFTQNVVLANCPAANDGYTLQLNDVIGLPGQTDTTQRLLYTYAAGVLTPLVTQPPDKVLLVVTKGAALKGTLWRFTQGDILFSQAASGSTTKGPNGWTWENCPDGAGYDLTQPPRGINRGLAKTAIGAGATVALFVYDCAAEGTSAGNVFLRAEVGILSNSGSNRGVVNTAWTFDCGTPPTNKFQGPHDDIDEGSVNNTGVLGHITLTTSVVGNTVMLSCTNNLGASIYVGGFVSGWACK